MELVVEDVLGCGLGELGWVEEDARLADPLISFDDVFVVSSLRREFLRSCIAA